MFFILTAALYVTIPSKNQTLFHCVTVPLRRMSLGLNWNFALKCFKHSNGIEIRNGIMFNFYLGLPHTCMHYKTVLLILYQAGALCRTLSKNWVAFSVWRDDHEPAHRVSNCQNPSIMLTWCACVEKLNTRVVNHTCKKSNINLRVRSLTTTLIKCVVAAIPEVFRLQPSECGSLSVA